MARTLIIGQGLAGSAVAWRLHQRGLPLLICDPQWPVTSSRIAAGLITPITGQRLVQAPDFLPAWQQALDFYREIETLTGTRFLDVRGAVRIFQSSREVQIFEERQSRGEYTCGTRVPQPPLEAEFTAPLGAFEMCTGGRLDVPGYLEATRSWFASRDSCHIGILETDSLVLKPDGVWVPQMGETFARVIFCQGYGPANPWFPDLPFNPAKGEILALKIHGLAELRTVHGGVWLARAGDVFLCGSTYDWAQLDTTPTSAGRAHILSGLGRLLNDPQAAIEVVEHRAAVRPTMQHFQPIAQVHPEHRQLGLLNGLGSKGSLLAPSLAGALVEELVTRA